MPTCRFNDLTDFQLKGDPDALFFIRDLDGVLRQDSTVIQIAVGKATCNVAFHDHSTPAAEEHAIAYAVTKDGALTGDDSLIALPCPPHCGEKGTYGGLTTVKVSEYNIRS